ncbi:unnamed protein product [Arctogadus glacialis]
MQSGLLQWLSGSGLEMRKREEESGGDVPQCSFMSSHHHTALLTPLLKRDALDPEGWSPESLFHLGPREAGHVCPFPPRGPCCGSEDQEVVAASALPQVHGDWGNSAQ